MKVLTIFGPLVFCFFNSFCQLNVQLLHQLVGISKSEYEKQVIARNRQSVNTTNELTNQLALSGFKEMYRKNESRFRLLGLVLDFAQIGLEATPLVTEIAGQQQQIFRLCQHKPILILLSMESQQDLADRSYQLLNYMYALLLSTTDLEQMKFSDRKILFSHVLIELRGLSATTRGLLMSLRQSQKISASREMNPFRGFLNRDRQLITEILNKTRIK